MGSMTPAELHISHPRKWKKTHVLYRPLKALFQIWILTSKRNLQLYENKILIPSEKWLKAAVNQSAEALPQTFALLPRASQQQAIVCHVAVVAVADGAWLRRRGRRPTKQMETRGSHCFGGTHMRVYVYAVPCHAVPLSPSCLCLALVLCVAPLSRNMHNYRLHIGPSRR